MKLKDEVMDLLRNLDKKNINLEYASEQVNKLFDEKSNPMSNIINDIRRLMDETKESDSVVLHYGDIILKKNSMLKIEENHDFEY